MRASIVLALIAACGTTPTTEPDAGVDLDASVDAITTDGLQIFTTDQGLTSYNFEIYKVGMTSFDLSLTVENTGTAASAPIALVFSGRTPADFALGTTPPDGCTGQVLTPSARCTLSVHFTPGDVGTRAAHLVPDSGATMLLAGTGD